MVMQFKDSPSQAISSIKVMPLPQRRRIPAKFFVSTPFGASVLLSERGIVYYGGHVDKRRNFGGVENLCEQREAIQRPLLKAFFQLGLIKKSDLDAHITYLDATKLAREWPDRVARLKEVSAELGYKIDREQLRTIISSRRQLLKFSKKPGDKRS